MGNTSDEAELNFESRRQPVKGLDQEPCGLIGGGGSPNDFSWMQLRDPLQAIRPCRESQTGWTPEAARLPGNPSSLALNERGPALNVFWSRRWRDGRRAGGRTRLPRPTRVVIEGLTKKTEPEGAGQETSGPLLSVRIEVQPGHQPQTR